MKVILKNKIQGFGLIEVLITVVIISVGMLATATLNIKSIQVAQDNLYRMQAITLVSDLASRIHANRNYFLTASPLDFTSTQRSACYTVGYTPGCSELYTNQNDIYEWQQFVSSALPSGFGIMCLDSTQGGMSSTDPATTTGCDNIDAPANDQRTIAIKVAWQKRSGNYHVIEQYITP